MRKLSTPIDDATEYVAKRVYDYFLYPLQKEEYKACVYY